MNYLSIKQENDRIFSEGGFEGMRSEYISDFIPKENPRKGSFSVSEHTVRQTTCQCIIANKGKNVIALNFANAIIPGGAYIMGGNAQEESLCRAGGLYYAIREQKEFYSANRRHLTADYTDGIIYTENVPFIRDDSGSLLEKPVRCGIITCPAVNRYEAFLIPREKTNIIMKRRIEKIVSLAASKSPDLIILGAFGCGAFGNKREEILPMFEGAIEKFGGTSAEYVFAIP